MSFLQNADQSLYMPQMSKIIHIDDLTSFEKRFEIELPEGQLLNHKPGQFVELSIFGYGEAPISVSSSPTRPGTFELTVRRTGRLTDKLHTFEAGQLVGIRGPYGNGFDVNRFHGKDILFVCGGIGPGTAKITD
jgi:sulfhydrogenase subunit gamma (sulfur reductase)